MTVSESSAAGASLSADAPAAVEPDLASEVVDYGVTPLVVRTGPCAAWCTGGQIATRPNCAAIDPSILADAATTASELLYVLSGKQFTGAACGPVTVRPVQHWPDADSRGWSRFSAGGYLTASSFWNQYGSNFGGIMLSYPSLEPPTVDLGAYPVTAIDQVTIDGVVIPANEYRLDDFRMLVRVMPTAASQPTERWGWPTWQRLDLPLTEEATFGVTFHFGMAPPSSGVLAARALGAEIALRDSGANRGQLPPTTTSINRQGVSAQVARLFDKIKEGQSGIPEVDIFLAAFNPTGGRSKATVWSPDVAPARRIVS